MITCLQCGSDDVAYYAMHIGYPEIPAGIYRFCGCRQCAYWWESESTAPTTIDGDHWKLTGHGKGLFTTAEEKAAARWELSHD